MSIGITCELSEIEYRNSVGYIIQGFGSRFRPIKYFLRFNLLTLITNFNKRASGNSTSSPLSPCDKHIVPGRSHDKLHGLTEQTRERKYVNGYTSPSSSTLHNVICSFVLI